MTSKPPHPKDLGIKIGTEKEVFWTGVRDAAKEAVDTKNSADQMVFQTEKQIEEMKDKMDEETVAKLTAALEELKTAKDGEDIEEMKAKMDELTKIWNEASEKIRGYMKDERM